MTTVEGIDLLQVDLLASGASLVWPRSGRPSRGRLVSLDGCYLQFAPKMGCGVTHILGFQVVFEFSSFYFWSQNRKGLFHSFSKLCSDFTSHPN